MKTQSSRTSYRSAATLVALVVAVSVANQWWVGRHESALGADVASLARPGDIRMLASESCGVCAEARLWFTEHRVPFTECLIERDAACRKAFEATGSPGTPVLVVRGRDLVGFNPGRLLGALQQPPT